MSLTTITKLTADSNSTQLDNGKVKSQKFGAKTSGLNVEALDVNVELTVLSG